MAFELPLFPLNTVLFPGMPLSLHVFEDRYMQMIRECIESEQPFGVVLIKEGVEALGPLAEPHQVGCTAELAQVQALDDGRMNILAIGRERFQILSLHHDRPYLRGTVDHFPLDVTLNRNTAALSERLIPWVEEYLTLLSIAGDVDFDTRALPTGPKALAYLASTVLQIPNDQKQDLLSSAGAESMLADIYHIYRRELPVLRMLLEDEASMRVGPGPFSLS